MFESIVRERGFRYGDRFAWRSSKLVTADGKGGRPEQHTSEHALIYNAVARQKNRVAWNLVQGWIGKLKHVPRHQILGRNRSPYGVTISAGVLVKYARG